MYHVTCVLFRPDLELQIRSVSRILARNLIPYRGQSDKVTELGGTRTSGATVQKLCSNEQQNVEQIMREGCDFMCG